MPFIFRAFFVVLIGGLLTKAATPLLLRLYRESNPYWQQLLAVHLTVIAFAVAFIIAPASLLALVGNGTVQYAAGRRALPLAQFASNAFLLANIVGIAGVLIRILHDWLIQGLDRISR